MKREIRKGKGKEILEREDRKYRGGKELNLVVSYCLPSRLTLRLIIQVPFSRSFRSYNRMLNRKDPTCLHAME